MNSKVQVVNYIKESLNEIKLISWPTREETRRYTVFVIVISVVAAAFFGGLDFLFNFILEKILKV